MISLSTRNSRVVHLLLFLAAISQAYGQTAEDSAGNSQSSPSTSLGGYGNALYQRDTKSGTAVIDLQRVVLFVGHRFDASVAFFSELELEDAKVGGGENGGEIAFEQAYVRFSFDRDHYLTAGLFLPRIGILNEDHLPTSFYGNERTQVETWIIPSTWRELGIGFYGSSRSLPISYSVGIVNGLNSALFEHGSGIREGRFEGRNASANNLAVTGSIQWSQGHLRTQLSGYYGGTVGLSRHEADSLQLDGGLFGTPVMLGEADAQYEARGIRVRILGAYTSIPDAYAINRAFNNNTPNSEYGAYVEVGYDVLYDQTAAITQSLIPFVRYELLDLNASVPTNGFFDPSLRQAHFLAGINYFPVPGVVVKGDVRFMTSSATTTETFLNFGIGLSF